MATVEINLNGLGIGCGHWETLVNKVEGWLIQQELDAVIHLNTVEAGGVVEPDGRLHILLGNVVKDGESLFDNVYILRGQGKVGIKNLPSCPSEGDIARVLSALETALPLIAPDPAQAERARAEQLARNREAWVAACSARFEKTLAGCRDAISRGESEVERLQKALTKQIRELNGQRRKLTQLSADGHATERECYGLEYDKLISLPKVREVEVKDGVVSVFTSILYCRDDRDNTMHEIGAFRIDLIMAGDVRWFNLTRKGPGDHHAPHVGFEGRACYGNTAEIWPELLANYEFVAAAIVAIQFVETANTDDEWGRRIREWPVAGTTEGGKT